MSAFLGPIHEKMYQRVLYQDQLAQRLLDFAQTENLDNALAEQVDAVAPAAVDAPLETIVDPNNIHGWLSQAVAQCETRFALIVAGILSQRPEALPDLERVMCNLGAQHSLTIPAEPQAAFEVIHDILLDGMPCDFPFAMGESDEEHVSWQVINCPHSPYWQGLSCPSDTYARLRDAWVSGALQDRGLTHTRTGDHHVIRTETAHE